MIRLAVAVAVALVALLITATPAWSADPPAPADAPTDKGETGKAPGQNTAKPPQKVDKIEVKASSTVDERREDTATKIVVSAEEINKFGDSQITDVLKRLPGITVTGSTIRMRGLGQGYTQILLDGERPPPGFTLEQLSPAVIERIEIIRAATAEFSTQSIAGTINIVLKKKVTFSQRELRANYASGSFYKSANLNFLVSDKAGELGYTVNGYVSRNTNNFPSFTTETGFDAGGNRILNRVSQSRSEGDGDSFGVGPRLVWTFQNGDSLNWQSFVNAYKGDGNSRFQYLLTEGAPVPSSSNVGKYKYDGNYARTDLNWIRKLAAGAKLDVKFGVNYSKNKNENVSQSLNVAGQRNFDRFSDNDDHETGYSFSGKYSTPIVEGHALAFGWDTGVSDRERASRQRDTPVAGVLPSIPAVNTDERFDASLIKLAAFAQDEWNVSKDWSLYLGVRWEGITTTSEGSGYSAVTNRSSVWSPIMQTLYKIPSRKGEQLRLALTRTYKAPQTNSLIPRRFTSVDNKPTSPDFTGNPDLKPELATGIDLAYEKFWDKGASMSLAASTRRITDYNRQGLRFIDGRWVSLPVNDGQANTRSLEYDAKFPVQTFFETAPPIDFRFNASRNWSRVDAIPGPNNRLDAQTPFSATLGMDYRMQGGIVTAGGSFSYRSGGEVRTSPNQTSFLTAKRDLDLYGLWKINPKLQVRLTLSNVLKPAAINERSYFDAFGSTRTSTETPSKMNVRAGIELKL